jgi:hypothetical protein
MTLPDAIEDRLLAHAPVDEVHPDKPLRLIELTTMSWQVKTVGARQERLEAAEKIAHAPFRWRDNASVPGHDVVTGKENAGVVKRKAQMIGRVTGCVKGLK